MEIHTFFCKYFVVIFPKLDTYFSYMHNLPVIIISV